MSDSKDKAVQLLMHYLELAGIRDSAPQLDVGDFASEMEEVVERISDYTLERLDERARQEAEASDLEDERIMDDLGQAGQL